jgi:hypothetical protein
VGLILSPIQRWQRSLSDREMHESQAPGFGCRRLQHCGSIGVERPHPEKIPFGIPDSCYSPTLRVLSEADIREVKNEPGHPTQRKSQGNPNKRKRCDTSSYRRPLHDRLSTSSPELVAVSPCGKLGPLRFADPHELETFAKAGETDLVSRDAKLRPAIRALALFDRLPSLFDRRKVPAFALPAHHPQAALRSVECESTPDRKMLDSFVRSELSVAEQTGRIHSLTERLRYFAERLGCALRDPGSDGLNCLSRSRPSSTIISGKARTSASVVRKFTMHARR